MLLHEAVLIDCIAIVLVDFGRNFGRVIVIHIRLLIRRRRRRPCRRSR